MLQDLKYLSAFSIPAVAIFSLWMGESWAYFTPVFAFVLIPIMELLLPVNTENLDKETADSKLKNKFFDVLLYLNLPIVYGIIGYFLRSLSWADYSTSAIIGYTFSVGIVLGANGINVAHELGHRKTAWERTLSKILLLPAQYMHFYIEHNFGHHLHAATENDPASAAYNQSVYSFWFTSTTRQYRNAWQIQKRLLKADNLSFFSLKNDMFWYLLLQLAYFGVCFAFFGLMGLLLAAVIALVGILLLETINYIEHYGLRRTKTKSGRYERVSEIHSWNSNHVLGRVILYELTRHSDHHYKASKKYQVLEYHEVSPQLPFGYPTSMVLAMVPPLWFSIMNKRVPKEMVALQTAA